MKHIIVQIDEEFLSELDAVAEQDGESRSALMRSALERFLAERRRHRDLQRTIDSFRRKPQEGDLALPKRAVRASWPD